MAGKGGRSGRGIAATMPLDWAWEVGGGRVPATRPGLQPTLRLLPKSMQVRSVQGASPPLLYSAASITHDTLHIAILPAR